MYSHAFLGLFLGPIAINLLLDCIVQIKDYFLNSDLSVTRVELEEFCY